MLLDKPLSICDTGCLSGGGSGATVGGVDTAGEGDSLSSSISSFQ